MRWVFIISLAMAGAISCDAGNELASHGRDMAVEKIEDGEKIDWYSPLEEPFSIYGLKWEASKPSYRRLPVNDDAGLPAKVDRLANCPAGGQIHFSTDSPDVWIRVTLDGIKWRHHSTPVSTSSSWTGAI